MEHFISTDILLKIGEYLNDIKEYIYLLQINKFTYQNILNNNYIFRTELFQYKLLTLTENLPKYLFKIENLSLNKKGNDFNLLNEFKYLKYLKLKKIPNDFIFSEMPNLEELYILNSNLQLNALLNLKKLLKTLVLDNCDFKEDCLRELNNLIKLNIRTPKTRISGECLQHLQNLTTLQSFNCFNDQNVAKYIKNLHNLKTLKLHEKINDTNFLNKLINLTELNIDYIYNINEQDFFNLQQLKKLSLYGRGQLNNCFKYLNNLKELECKLENIDNFNSIKNTKKFKIMETSNFDENILKNVTNLVSFYCFLQHFQGYYLGNSLNLTELSLTSTEVKDEYLINLRKLKQLELNYCELITGECLQNMKELEELNISVTNIEDKYLENLNQLYFLDISCCEKITGNCLQNLTRLVTLNAYETNIKDENLVNLKQLTNLDISCCKDITGECLLNLPKLKKLSCHEISNIKDEHLINLKSLKSLIISKCMNITGECLLYLNHLKTLDIERTNVKEEYLMNLLKLNYLNIKDCPNIIKGKFLLNMKKINQIGVSNYLFESDNSINALKQKIQNGKTLKEIIQSLGTINDDEM